MSGISSSFTWGRIEEQVHLGPYTFVKYRPYVTGTWDRLSKRPVEPVFNYHIYVDGKDTHQGAHSLEGAMVLAIAYKHIGPGVHGLDMLTRALNFKDEAEPA